MYVLKCKCNIRHTHEYISVHFVGNPLAAGNQLDHYTHHRNLLVVDIVVVQTVAVDTVAAVDIVVVGTVAVGTAAVGQGNLAADIVVAVVAVVADRHLDLVDILLADRLEDKNSITRHHTLLK